MKHCGVLVVSILLMSQKFFSSSHLPFHLSYALMRMFVDVNFFLFQKYVQFSMYLTSCRWYKGKRERERGEGKEDRKIKFWLRNLLSNFTIDWLFAVYVFWKKLNTSGEEEEKLQQNISFALLCWLKREEELIEIQCATILF